MRRRVALPVRDLHGHTFLPPGRTEVPTAAFVATRSCPARRPRRPVMALRTVKRSKSRHCPTRLKLPVSAHSRLQVSLSGRGITHVPQRKSHRRRNRPRPRGAAVNCAQPGSCVESAVLTIRAESRRARRGPLNSTPQPGRRIKQSCPRFLSPIGPSRDLPTCESPNANQVQILQRRRDPEGHVASRTCAILRISRPVGTRRPTLEMRDLQVPKFFQSFSRSQNSVDLNASVLNPALHEHNHPGYLSAETSSTDARTNGGPPTVSSMTPVEGCGIAASPKSKTNGRPTR